MGPAVAISMLFTIAAALTLAPAILTLGSLFGLFDPRRVAKGHLYRRIATSVVRWPKPVFVASTAIVMIGAVFVPTYRVSYDDRAYQPSDGAANLGFAASDRHFSQSKLFSEMLMVESDHDMRNSADFISLDRVAKSLIRLPGVAMVQSITRPLGRPLSTPRFRTCSPPRAVAAVSSCRSTSSRTRTPTSRPRFRHVRSRCCRR